MSKKPHQLSRRDFFSRLGGASISTYVAKNSQFIKFMGAAVANLMVKSAYGAGGTNNYLCFLHSGAPPRWNFDGFLATDTPIIDGAQTQEFIPHPVVKNVFKSSSGYQTTYNGQNSDTRYETSLLAKNYLDAQGTNRKLYLPKLWDITLPTWNGSIAFYNSKNVVKMRDLLDNILMIRGFQLPADFGHFGGPAYLIRPDPALASISGLVADQAAQSSNRRLIPAIALTDSPARPLGFRSVSAKITLASSGSGNPASDILTPFLRTDSLVANHKGNRALMDAVMKEAMTVYKTRAVVENPKSQSLYNDNSAVVQLMEKLKGSDLVSEFTTAKAKYTQLGMACAEKYPGLIGDLKLTKNASGVYTKHSYARDDYSSHFAIAEVFIRHGLTSSFTFMCGGTAAPGSYVGKSNNAFTASNDEHNITNRQMSFLAHDWKNRFFMSCVNEFKNTIGANWKNTVIQYGAEYNRSPNKGSGGSDHAINACCTTVISGAINQFMPVGNIYKTKITDPTHSNYGTYGVGAPTNIQGAGSIKITHKIVANTVLTLLGLPSPFRDKWSLIKTNGQGFSLNAEYPKNK